MQRPPPVTRIRCWSVLPGFRPILFSDHQIPRGPQYRPLAPNKHRGFSTSPFLYKKKEKTRAITGTDSGKLLSKAGVTSEDPHDFSQLHDGIAAALSRFKDELSKLRVGGRFNTGSIENLRVQLSKGSKETARLGDLAQVVPKGGRMVTILASEDDVSY